MAVGGSFVIASEWYWRIFEDDPRFASGEAAQIARDFVRPLAHLAKDHVEITEIAVDPDGDGIQLRIADRLVEIRCAGLRVEHFVDEINRQLAVAEIDFAFALVESRRYELRGALVPRNDAAHRVFARGTLPPRAKTQL
jgi:hypothetical protein